MKTFQDWQKVASGTDKDRMLFVKNAIAEFKSSDRYKNAIYGEDYYAGKNTTIKTYEKLLINARGQAVPDCFSASHKIASRFFYRDVKQANSVLLGNGCKWKNGKGADALGDDFDNRLMDAGRNAQVGGVAYGFYNNGRVIIFKAQEFVPMIDEEDGAIKAGFRFWQIDAQKPMRATVYELDGYTEYVFDKENPDGKILFDKRAYMIIKKESVADGEEIYDFMNYPTFPIIPLYANDMKESELLPIRSTIDAFDLINSGYANDVDDANIIYWTITNAGGMDDVELVQFLDKMRKMHAAQLDDDQQITPHTVEIPVTSREAILDRLEKQLYKDAMALNTYDLSSGAVTATQIEAAYEPLNEKLDGFESNISEFVQGLLAVAGVEDDATYDRSIVINKAEEIDTVIQSANYLDDEYITQKIMTILGDKDQIDDVIDRMNAENLERMATASVAESTPPVNETTEVE